MGTKMTDGVMKENVPGKGIDLDVFEAPKHEEESGLEKGSEQVGAVITPADKGNTPGPGSESAPAQAGTSAGSVSVPTGDKELEEIENILQEDLGDVYASLPPETREEFKVEGEKTAVEIKGLVERVKIKTRKIFQLIKNWLKIIPGVNRFFLEQEAKIKTDEILDLAEKEKNQKL